MSHDVTHVLLWVWLLISGAIGIGGLIASWREWRERDRD